MYRGVHIHLLGARCEASTHDRELFNSHRFWFTVTKLLPLSGCSAVAVYYQAVPESKENHL